MTTYRDLINRSQKLIRKNNLEDRVVFILLEHLLDLNMAQIISNMDKEVPQNILEDFSELLSEYIVDEKPVGYIIGYTYFYTFKIKVNENVLIPRKETEEVVEEALNILKGKQNLLIADIGSGSGNIAIALKKNLDSAKVYSVDISKKALEVAKENAVYNDAIIEFINENLLDYFIRNNIKLDVIISNPPYIDENYQLDKNIIEYEPQTALFAPNRGTYYYEEMLKKSSLVLKEDGYIIFEIGFDQKEILEEYVKKYLPKSTYYFKKDLGGNDRILVIKNK